MFFLVFLVVSVAFSQITPSFLTVNQTGALQIDGNVAFVAGGSMEAYGKTDLKGPVTITGPLQIVLFYFLF